MQTAVCAFLPAKYKFSTWIIHWMGTILVWILQRWLRWCLMEVSAIVTVNTISTGKESTWCRPFAWMSRSWHRKFTYAKVWFANNYAMWRINGSSGSLFRKKNPILFSSALILNKFPWMRAQSLQCIMGMSLRKGQGLFCFDSEPVGHFRNTSAWERKFGCCWQT